MPNGTPTRTGSIIAAVPVLIGLGTAGFDANSDTPTDPADPAVVTAAADSDAFLATFSADERALLAVHVFGGLPSIDHVDVRQGYVRSYDSTNRVPRWVAAYRVAPGFLETPARSGRFSSFRIDRDLDSPVRDGDYLGLSASRGYARGHLAPYAVMGGDRDGDGVLAPDDDFDSQTVFQSNLMSNVAPQHHASFNGSGGMWFQLERFIQDTVVETGGLEVSVFAGTIFGYGQHERVGPNGDIGVPPLFFKMVVRESVDPEDDLPVVLAFLFPHHRTRHGEISDYLTSVDVIEALSGLDFFNELGTEAQFALEDPDTFDNWEGFVPAPSP